MELIAFDVGGFHLGIADLDALLVGSSGESAFDFQTGLGRRRGDQLDDGQPVRQWSAAPILRDVTEQTMLDFIPFRRARRVVVYVEYETGLIGELLQLHLP